MLQIYMCRVILLFKFILILSLFSNNSFAESKNGTGELKLSRGMVNYFIDYIRGKQFRYPSVFYVTVDGTDGSSWYCSEMTNCRSGSLQLQLADCLRATGKECKRFAVKRTIKWNNGINLGKGKTSRIKNKWSDQEIRSYLKELGF